MHSSDEKPHPIQFPRLAHPSPGTALDSFASEEPVEVRNLELTDDALGMFAAEEAERSRRARDDSSAATRHAEVRLRARAIEDVRKLGRSARQLFTGSALALAVACGAIAAGAAGLVILVTVLLRSPAGSAEPVPPPTVVAALPEVRAQGSPAAIKPPIAPPLATSTARVRDSLGSSSNTTIDSPTLIPAPAEPALAPQANAGAAPASGVPDLMIPVTPTIDVEDTARAIGTVPPPARTPSNRTDLSPNDSAPPNALPVRPPASDAVATPAPVAVPEASIPAIVGEETAVRAVLNRYLSAYGSLNVEAAKAVWPSVDARALGRAFSSLESQEFDFTSCQISVNADTATALCGGTARFVPKVGNKSERSETREWTFEMRKTDTQWTIASVDVR